MAIRQSVKSRHQTILSLWKKHTQTKHLISNRRKHASSIWQEFRIFPKPFSDECSNNNKKEKEEAAASCGGQGEKNLNLSVCICSPCPPAWRMFLGYLGWLRAMDPATRSVSSLRIGCSGVSCKVKARTKHQAEMSTFVKGKWGNILVFFGAYLVFFTLKGV